MKYAEYQSLTKITYWRINNDVNGNPRYIIHYLAVNDDYRKALNITHSLGGKRYRAKWFGGGLVFSTYNIDSFFEKLEILIKKEAQK